MLHFRNADKQLDIAEGRIPSGDCMLWIMDEDEEARLIVSKKVVRDRRTDGQTDGGRYPLIEMYGRRLEPPSAGL